VSILAESIERMQISVKAAIERLQKRREQKGENRRPVDPGSPQGVSAMERE
jgi:hypothetical protein